MPGSIYPGHSLHLEHRHIRNERLFGADIAAEGGGFFGEADVVQDIGEFAGDGDAGHRGHFFAILIVSKPYLAADIIAVEVYLQTGHGNDLEALARKYAFVGSACVDQCAAKAAGGSFAKILTETVCAEIIDGFAVFNHLDGTERHTVLVEFGASDISLGFARHGDCDRVAFDILLDMIALLEKVCMGINGRIIEVICNLAH